MTLLLPNSSDRRVRGDHGDVPTYGAQTSLPYPHRERAAAGLRAQLRYLVPAGEAADWSTFTVTGPVEVPDASGNTWFEYSARVSTSLG
jgi:hypothetical protein